MNLAALKLKEMRPEASRKAGNAYFQVSYPREAHFR